MAHYDVVVLGCGPGGERAAIQAARAGKTVAVVERAHVVGGNRVNWGTIPSKTLRESAVFFYQLTRNRLHGIRYEVGPELTVADFMYRERAVVQRELELINESLGRYAVEVIQGHARFAVSPRGRGHAPGRRRDAHSHRRLLRHRHRLAPEPARRRALRRRDRLRLGDDPAAAPHAEDDDGARGRGRRDRVREHLRRPRHRGHPGRHARPAAAVPRPRDRGRARGRAHPAGSDDRPLGSLRPRPADVGEPAPRRLRDAGRTAPGIRRAALLRRPRRQHERHRPRHARDQARGSTDSSR